MKNCWFKMTLSVTLQFCKIELNRIIININFENRTFYFVVFLLECRLCHLAVRIRRVQGALSARSLRCGGRTAPWPAITARPSWKTSSNVTV